MNMRVCVWSRREIEFNQIQECDMGKKALFYSYLREKKNPAPTLLRNSVTFMLYFYFHRDLKFGFGTDLGLLTPLNSLVLAKSDASADVLRRFALKFVWILHSPGLQEGRRILPSPGRLAAWYVVWPWNNENAVWISHTQIISHMRGRQTHWIVWDKGFLSRGGRGI